MSSETPTPRTDAYPFHVHGLGGIKQWVSADFARTLERELAEFQRTEPLKRDELRTLRAENEALRKRVNELDKTYGS